MADLNKFEEMLERLINEDQSGAEELFHEIVVEKSREIYENILAEDADEEVDETTDEEVDESDDEEVEEASDDELDEDFNLDEFEVEADDDEMDMDMGGDETDDMLGDIEGDDEMDMDDEGDEDIEDRVVDLEDALDELKAEFEKMAGGDMGDEEGEEDEMDMGDEEEGEEEPEEESYEFESTDEEVDESDDEEVEEADDEKSETETMREYVEKVTAKMGDTGTNGTKSAVAGKNDMGGTAGNIAQSGTEAGVEANKGNLKGSALSDQNAKEDNAGNVNVPGGKASKSMKNQPKPKMGDTGTNGTKSVVGQ